MKHESIYKLTLTALMAALSYVVFTFLQIKIWLPGGDAVSFHFGNAVCVLAALILGGPYGGLAGAIGMTIADLCDPIYVIYAPKTFILKLCIGLITGLAAHRFGKITESGDIGHVFRWTALAAACGLGFNAIFDPLLSYFYKIVLLGKPAAEAVLAWNFTATGVNAVISAVAGTAIYMALRPVLKAANLFLPVGRKQLQ